MSTYESVLNILSVGRAVPFEYDHHNRAFHAGGATISPEDIPRYGYIHSEVGGTPDEIERWAQTESFLITRNPITTKIGREAIGGVWSSDLQRETREVMADVLSEHLGDIVMADSYDFLKKRSFGVEKFVSNEVFVQTIGQCACLGVDYTVHNSWREAGFSEYTYHNVDMRPQTVALLAGIGHIAHSANRSIR